MHRPVRTGVICPVLPCVEGELLCEEHEWRESQDDVCGCQQAQVGHGDQQGEM